MLIWEIYKLLYKYLFDSYRSGGDGRGIMFIMSMIYDNYKSDIDHVKNQIGDTWKQPFTSMIYEATIMFNTIDCSNRVSTIHNIIHMDLQKYYFNNDIMPLIGLLVNFMPKLQVLKLCNNEITTTGAVSLMENITNRATWLHIDLYHQYRNYSGRMIKSRNINNILYLLKLVDCNNFTINVDIKWHNSNRVDNYLKDKIRKINKRPFILFTSEIVARDQKNECNKSSIAQFGTNPLYDKNLLRELFEFVGVKIKL